MFAFFRSLAFCFSVLILAGQAFALDTPPENIEKPKPEAIDAFPAEKLLASINSGTPDNDLFFPADPFAVLKAIAKPLDYHKQLLKWYQGDIKREHEAHKGPLTFKSFKLGFCKWKEKGSEGNAIPYLSCYKSLLKVENAEKKEETITVRVVINWGKNWYITHLGPIPKT